MSKKVIFTIGLLLISGAAFAQYPLSQRVTYSNPASLSVAEDDIEWNRIVYREISVDQAANAGLFYQAGSDCFFSRIFREVLLGNIKAYNYAINDDAVFSLRNETDVPVMLRNFQIPFRSEVGKLSVDQEDMPSHLVKSFYIKESHYYDTRNSSFRKRCLAICPVMYLEDDLGVGETKYPMFWVRYSEIEPLLQEILVLGDAYNPSSVMSAGEFFSAGYYTGDIYKVFNTRDIPLATYCDTPEKLLSEQQRIESELADVREHCYDSGLEAKPSVSPITPDKTKPKPGLVARIKAIFKKQK